jgi:hypothetical protein
MVDIVLNGCFGRSYPPLNRNQFPLPLWPELAESGQRKYQFTRRNSDIQ